MPALDLEVTEAITSANPVGSTASPLFSLTFSDKSAYFQV